MEDSPYCVISSALSENLASSGARIKDVELDFLTFSEKGAVCNGDIRELIVTQFGISVRLTQSSFCSFEETHSTRLVWPVILSVEWEFTRPQAKIALAAKCDVNCSRARNRLAIMPTAGLKWAQIGCRRYTS